MSEGLGRRGRLALEEVLWRRAMADPLVFLAVARTLDEHAPEGEPALRGFPLCAVCAGQEGANAVTRVEARAGVAVAVCAGHGRRHLPYIAGLTRTWQGSEILAFEKSRQMLATCWAVIVHLWAVLRRPGALVAFQSLSRAKSCELLDRAALVYAALPRELQRFGPLSDAPKARARKIEDRLTFVHEVDGRRVESRIIAIPNGRDHVRMYTFSHVLIDEAQFWENDEEFEDSYAAALATVKGGAGCLTAISSVNHAGTFHHKLCDQAGAVMVA